MFKPTSLALALFLAVAPSTMSMTWSQGLASSASGLQEDMPIQGRASGFNFDDIPDIAGGVGLIDQQKERKIGEKVFREVQAQLPILEDDWVEGQLMQVFTTLLGQTQLGEPIALVLVNDRQINAFAVPGGLFAINAGLISNAKNLDEVAGVMAHEIAHVTQRHYSRSTDAFKGQGLISLAGIVAGILIASAVDPDVGGAVMMGTQAGMIDRQLSYSRNQEREADRVGLQYLYRAGFNPESMADFFETMHRATSRISFLPDFWLTHPLTSQRMSEARLFARQLPSGRVQSRLGDDFNVLKLRISVQSSAINEQQLKALLGSQPFAAQLALAELYLGHGDFEKAEQALQKAAAIQPNHTLLTLLQTNLALAKNQLDKALQLVQARQRVMPENRALNLKLAEVHIRLKQFQTAQTLLQPLVNRNVRDIRAWSLLERTARLNPNKEIAAILALRYRAEVEFWTGKEETAIKSLLHAERLATKSDSQSLKASVSQRLKELQEERKLKL